MRWSANKISLVVFPTGGKAFFFEKKKQKTFLLAVADLIGECGGSRRKSFLVLFFKKGLLASKPSACR
jgi:hypothetical protein